MKTGWRNVPLGSLCTVKNGKSDTQDAVESGEFVFFDRSKTVKRSSRFLFECEALIVPGEGIEFLPRHFVGKFDLHQRAYALQNFAAGIDVRFLYHYLHHRRDYLPSVAVGATVKSLRMRHFEGFPVAVTSLDEQHRIVAILDEAFAGIATAKANAEQNLKNARALFESELETVFSQRGDGWEEKPLETVASILSGFAFRSTDFSSESGVKCIKITNVGVGAFVHDDSNFLPREFSARFHAVSVPKGSIVLALTRSIIADGLKVAVVPEEYDGALLNQRVAAIAADRYVISGRFLFSYLTTRAVADYVGGRVNTLMQPNLSIGDLRAMPIPVPSLLIQNRISDRLVELQVDTQRLTSLYQLKLAALDELKKSLLHQAFSGQL